MTDEAVERRRIEAKSNQEPAKNEQTFTDGVLFIELPKAGVASLTLGKKQRIA